MITAAEATQRRHARTLDRHQAAFDAARREMLHQLWLMIRSGEKAAIIEYEIEATLAKMRRLMLETVRAS